MNSKPLSSKSTSFNVTKENNTTSKLRRLKIEENILLQCLKKHDQKTNYEITESDRVGDSDCKLMMKNLKDSYIKIKNLFDDIKIITSSQELLADVEINEIKNRVMELESTMRSFKLHLAAELNLLMSAEHELTKQLEDINLRGGDIKRRAKIASASFIQAVPSPVRLLMTSPLKCSEVQEFQDFMTNSPNRYGGWNEYHINIFVMQWQKHFGNHLDSYYSDLVADKLAFENFVEECLFKLQDKNSLITHIDWHKKYLYLKSKQQTAINKWKSTRKSTRKTPEGYHQVHNNSTKEIEINRKTKYRKVKKEIINTTQKAINNDDIERLMKPTKQWLCRCEYEQTMEPINDIESLEKLGIPNWRKYL